MAPVLLDDAMAHGEAQPGAFPNILMPCIFGGEERRKNLM
jgi:hypothetical protein